MINSSRQTSTFGIFVSAGLIAYALFLNWYFGSSDPKFFSENANLFLTGAGATGLCAFTFGRTEFVRKNSHRAVEAIKIYAFVTLLTAAILVVATLSGVLSHANGSPIGAAETTPHPTNNHHLKATPRAEASEKDKQSLNYRVGTAIFWVINLETDVPKDLEFVLEAACFIAVFKALSGSYMAFFGCSPAHKKPTGIPTTPMVPDGWGTEAWTTVQAEEEAWTTVQAEEVATAQADAVFTRVVNKITDPWRYVYIAFAKVVIIYTAIGSGLLPVSAYFGWTKPYWLNVLSLPLCLANGGLIIGITILIGTDWLDAKMRQNRWLAWLA